MTEKIRLGLIGCGRIAQSRHVPGMTLLKRAGLDNFEVTAICDTVEDNLVQVGAALRQEQDASPVVYRDWNDLVAHGPVDAVDICLPHGLHHVVGIRALDAGLHVLVEKPYTVSIKTGRALAEAADRSGTVLAVAVPHRRMPGERAVAWALNEARLIGEVRAFIANYTDFRPPRPQGALPPQMVWRRDRVMGGGAGVIDSGFHFLDTIRYFYGEPEQVYAEVRAYREGQPVVAREGIAEERENTVLATFSFQNGVIGHWGWSNALAGKPTHNLMIYGSEGSIEDTGYDSIYAIYHQFMSEAELCRADGTTLQLPELDRRHREAIGPERVQRLYPNGVTDHFATEIWDFLDAIENRRRPEVDGWDALKTLALVEGIYESSWSGRAVKIADVLSGEAPYGWQRDIDTYWENANRV